MKIAFAVLLDVRDDDLLNEGIFALENRLHRIVILRFQAGNRRRQKQQ